MSGKNVNINDLSFKNKIEKEPGEEHLYQVCDFKQRKKSVSVLAGVDCGSTQTRVTLFSPGNVSFDPMYIYPSVSSFVPDDRELIPKDGSLYSVMDTTITNQSPNIKNILQKERVIRGNKFRDSLLSENKLDSTGQKIDNMSFYANLIDALGYSICERYGKEIPDKVTVYLGVALPPDDISSTLNKNKFFKEITNLYRWKLNDLNIQIDLDIVACDVLTEPEAFFQAYHLINQLEVPEVSLHLEGGGRSFGVALFVDGIAIDSASATLPFGGNQLASSLGDSYIAKYGGRKPSLTLLAKALKTGTLKNGSSYIDVTDLICQVKNEFAKKIFDNLISLVFDQQTKISFESVDTVSVSGRIFDEGTYDVSLATPLCELFKAKSPHIEFNHIEDSYISHGLALLMYKNYMGYLEEEVSSDLVTEES